MCLDIRLIAMDLDGTALQKDRCYFSPRLLETLHKAHERGITIVPVTGRQFGLLPPVLQEAHPWKNLAVLCNGGQIRSMHTGAYLHRMDMDPQALEQLLEVAAELHLPIEFSLDSKLHLTQKDWDQQLPWEDLAFHRNTILANHGRVVESLRDLCGPGVEKVNLLCISEEKREAVMQRLQSVAVSAVWSSATSLEITHPDATKGNALHRLCQLLQISVENVMALGDSGNDITMLQQAGLGVAMGNAPDFVKAAADVCAPRHDEDGAAIAIETYALA